MDDTDKRRAALAALGACDGVVVALSGGVDSAVLLALAVEALGPRRVLAVTGVSASLAGEDLEAAGRVARWAGVRHETVLTEELDDPGYRANRGDRCFHCRSVLFASLARLAADRGLARVAYGAIADDLGDHRPGMAAAERMGVLAPLLDAGYSKRDVRDTAAAMGLPVADKPAGACLASRIPVGTEVTTGRLGRVERAERALRELGFGQLRVRHHEAIARLELDDDGLVRIADPALRSRVVEAVQDAGFRFVTVDLAGYRPGGGLALATPPRQASDDPAG